MGRGESQSFQSGQGTRSLREEFVYPDGPVAQQPLGSEAEVPRADVAAWWDDLTCVGCAPTPAVLPAFPGSAVCVSGQIGGVCHLRRSLRESLSLSGHDGGEPVVPLCLPSPR